VDWFWNLAIFIPLTTESVYVEPFLETSKKKNARQAR